MPSWSRMPSTISRPPLTRLTTPGGRSSESITSKAICWVIGTCSDGLRMNVLPHAIANGRNQNGTIAGKLKGTIAAQTPTGWRIVSQSTLRATSSRMRPCIVVGIAVAASTISIMRETSARASAIVLPISVVTERARSSWRGAGPSRAPNNLLGGGDEPLAQLDQLAGAVDRADLAPDRERLARGAEGGVEVAGARERHAG